MNTLKTDYIKIFDIDLDQDIIEKIISIDPYLEPAMTSAGDTNYRKCQNLWFNEHVALNMGLPSIFKEIYYKLDFETKKVIGRYQQEFLECKKSVVGDHQGFNILKYNEGNKYDTHIDDFGHHAFRRLSISLLLNDDFTGGEFEFFGTETISLKKSQALIFPSSWLYPHRILPITSGIRRSVVTWVI
jgi:hypothetical protein